MISTAPIITDGGKSLQIRSLAGEQITFTGFKIGNGVPTSAENLTDLVSPKLSFGITSKDDTQTGYFKVTGQFANTDITETFKWTELGLFCMGEDTASFSGDGSTKTFTITDKPSAVNKVKVSGTAVTVSSYNATTGVVTLAAAPAAGTNNVVAYYPDDTPVLYAYCYDANGGNLVANATDVTCTQAVSIIVAVGDATQVTAIISASALYPLKTDFDAHVAAQNPHGTTKSDVGLGNVPNVSTNNQTPTWTIASAVVNLVSGETLSVAFGKIAKAITALSSHISSKQNPHEVSLTQVAGTGYVNNIVMEVTFADSTTATYNLVGKSS